MIRTVEFFNWKQFDVLMLFPQDAHIVLALPRNSISTLAPSIQKVTQSGYRAIPTLPARRIYSHEELESLMVVMRERSVEEVMIVGGNDATFHIYQDSLALLTSLAQMSTPIKRVYFAGHPESVRGISSNQILDALKQKETVARQAGWETYIITQLCLSHEAVAHWIRALRLWGVSSSVLVGVTGPGTRDVMNARLEMCSIYRHTQFTSTYSIFDSIKDTYDPSDFIKTMRSQALELGVAGFHWYGFDDMSTVAHELLKQG